MAINYPSPYGLRYKTVIEGLSHKGELLVNITDDIPVGTAFVDITVNTKGGGTDSLADVITSYFPLYRALFDVDTDIAQIELWKYAPSSYDATFISSTTTAYVGSNAGTNNLTWYQLLTFRSINGGIGKIMLPEGAQNNPSKLLYASLNAAEQALVNYVTGSTSPILARDNGYLSSLSYMSGGQNEKFFRLRNR